MKTDDNSAFNAVMITRAHAELDAEDARRFHELQVAKARAALAKWIVIGLVVIGAALAWIFRWQLEPLHRGDGAASAYVMNRVTGQLILVFRDESFDVTHQPPTPGK